MIKKVSLDIFCLCENCRKNIHVHCSSLGQLYKWKKLCCIYAYIKRTLNQNLHLSYIAAEKTNGKVATLYKD